MTNNFIEIYENALSDNLCDLLIDEFEHQDSLGNTHNGSVGPQGVTDERRKDSVDFSMRNHYLISEKNKSSAIFFNGISYLNIINNLFEIGYKYISKYNLKYEFQNLFVNTEKNKFWDSKVNFKKDDEIYNNEYIKHSFNLTGCFMKRYRKNKQGYHQWHSDYNPSNSIIKSHVIMFYLNDVTTGGETEFYYHKFKIKPKKGTCVVFPAYFTHMHKGHIPISNDKYILNMWFKPGYHTPDKK